MQRVLGLILCTAIGWALSDAPLLADWTRVEINGVSVCKDATSGAQFKPPYPAKADVTKACNTLTAFVPWLGTADAQQVAIFRGSIPTGIDVGTAPTPPPILPPVWTQIDIGSPPVAGSAFVSQGVMTIIGSGDVGATTDTAHFVYQSVTGDQRIEAQIQTVLGTGDYRKCGLMARDAAATANSKMVALAALPGSPTLAPVYHGRVNDGDYAGGIYNGTVQALPLWERLDLIGSTITAYTSVDHSTWESRSSTTLTMTGSVDLGAFTSSGGEATSATCTLTEPTITAIGSSPTGVVDFNTSTQQMVENAADPTICLTRSGGNSGAASANVTNLGTGTAVSGTDFTNPPFPKTLSWSAGQSGDQCFTLVVADRSGIQTPGTRTLNMGIASPSGVTVGATIVNQTLTITDKDNVAIKFQPGWYGGYNTTCSTAHENCTAAAVVSVINSEICANANLVGMKLAVEPAYLIPDTAGDYTGNSGATGPPRGFAVIDPILQALRNCGKYLMLEATAGPFGGFGAPNTMVPAFTYPSSGCGLYTCANGTATGSNYGVVPNTQASQPGFTAKVWKNDWRDLAIAATTAYCARYDSNPAFYSINMIYYNTSLPFTYPYTNGYDETTYHAAMYAYHAAARAACPTTNIPQIEDYVDNCAPTSCTRMIADIADLKTNHGVVTNNDISLSGPSHGQGTYSGAYTGSEDDRGVVRFIEAFEGPCYGTGTPTQIFDMLQNGNANQRARWPNTIVIWMTDGCNATQDWSAWKTFINSKSGQVMDARGPTLRTPAYIKQNSCETAQVCQ